MRKVLLGILALFILAGIAACVNSARYTSHIEEAHPSSGNVLRVNGADVHVLTAGSAGPPVMMIHGASANAREFEHLSLIHI